MTVAYSYLPVVEEVLIDRLSKYLHEECKWADQFPKFPHVRINNEYPWVPYMTSEDSFTNGWLDLSKVSETLFPAVTIITSQDNKSPDKFQKLEPTTLYKEEFEDFKAQALTDGFLISPAALQEMETYFLTHDELYGLYTSWQRQDTINIDITTDDETNIKNRLYDLLSLFLVGQGSLSMKTDLNIAVLNQTVSGTRSGIYNNDFGRVLRGATIHFNADYIISQVFYNTSAQAINEIVIDHTVSVLGG